MSFKPCPFLKTGVLFALLLPCLALGTMAECAWSLVQLSLKEPREVELSLHHGNFDAFGHLNSSVYLDLVNTALRRAIGRGSAPLGVDSGRAEINFKRAIDAHEITLKLYLPDHPSENDWVHFEILSRDKSISHADGKYMLSNVMNKDSKPVILPNDPAAGGRTNWGVPLEYRYSFPVLFNDFDTGRHMDVSRYLNYVNTSRLYYMQEALHLSPVQLVQHGVGFFLTRAEMTHFEPVTSMQSVTYRSWLSNIRRRGTGLEVPYAVQNDSGSTIYSQGILYFAVIDTNKVKPKLQPIPDWLLPYFIHDPIVLP